jgi:hypothetical protein
MRRLMLVVCAVAVSSLPASSRLHSVEPVKAEIATATQVVTNDHVPTIPFESVPNPLKYSPDLNLGEVLGVAVNSKGHLMVLNHPGSAASGPLYGNATTQLLEFDETGKLVREVGRGVYGLGYAHSVRYDSHDNLWVVDKGTHTVMRFNPGGYVTLNLGRRPEGPDEPDWFKGNGLGRGGAEARPAPQHIDGYFRAPTDVAWDTDDNIYISDGYVNSRVAKFDKHGNWVKSWGTRGTGGTHAIENPSQFNTPHNVGIDRQNHIFVADRGNRRIQVFDRDGNFERFIVLNAPYDKSRHPVLGSPNSNPPDETQPWTVCITNGPTQYLYTSDQEPGRIYKLTLDGKIVGMLGESGHELRQFNWVHGLACPADDVLYVADMNNWRVQKLLLHPDKAKVTSAY